VAAHSSLSKAEFATALAAVTSTVADAIVQGEIVTIAGFGKFAARIRAHRKGSNPRTVEPARGFFAADVRSSSRARPRSGPRAVAGRQRHVHPRHDDVDHRRESTDLPHA